jgi:quinol monooxygenase YgiN
MRDILYVIAKLQARPGKEETIKGLMQPLVEQTKKEKGCLSYELFHDRKNPAVFTLVEQWESEADVNTHLGQPHMQKLFAQLPELVSAAPEIGYYKKLG